jgi:hypothetical protein
MQLSRNAALIIKVPARAAIVSRLILFKDMHYNQSYARRVLHRNVGMIAKACSIC